MEQWRRVDAEFDRFRCNVCPFEVYDPGPCWIENAARRVAERVRRVEETDPGRAKAAAFDLFGQARHNTTRRRVDFGDARHVPLPRIAKDHLDPKIAALVEIRNVERLIEPQSDPCAIVGVKGRHCPSRQVGTCRPARPRQPAAPANDHRRRMGQWHLKSECAEIEGHSDARRNIDCHNVARTFGR